MLLSGPSKRLPDAEEDSASTFSWVAVELDTIIEAEQEVRRSCSQPNPSCLPDFGDAEIGGMRVNIPEIEEADAVKDPPEGQPDFVIDDEHRVPAERLAGPIERAEPVLLKASNRGPAPGKEAFARG
jgi:hypothetical protein